MGSLPARWPGVNAAGFRLVFSYETFLTGSKPVKTKTRSKTPERVRRPGSCFALTFLQCADSLIPDN
jgi:hypothetical protein